MMEKDEENKMKEENYNKQNNSNNDKFTKN